MDSALGNDVLVSVFPVGKLPEMFADAQKSCCQENKLLNLYEQVKGQVQLYP